MKKRNILIFVLDSVFILAFNILFFVNGGISHSSAMWTVYAFLHFSYFAVMITPLISAKGSTRTLSKTTTYTISLFYFVAELFFVIIVGLLGIKNIKVVVSLETVVTAIYVVFLVVYLLLDDTIENKQRRHNAENNFIKGISTQLKYIQSIETDNKLKTKLENLYYLAHSSPTKSTESVKSYESEIVRNIGLLEDAVRKNESAEILSIMAEIEKLLNRRGFELKVQY